MDKALDGEGGDRHKPIADPTDKILTGNINDSKDKAAVLILQNPDADAEADAGFIFESISNRHKTPYSAHGPGD